MENYINKNYLENALSDALGPILNVLVEKTTFLEDMLSFSAANLSGWKNATSPVNLQGITTFEVRPFVFNGTGIDVGDGAKLSVEGTKGILSLPGSLYRKNNWRFAFSGCNLLNTNIQIPYGTTVTEFMFDGCTNLNQNILIPNSVTEIGWMFNRCTKLNQNIAIPNSITNAGYMFSNCPNLNQNILIHNSVTDTTGMFIFCTNLNQNIAIPNNVTDTSSMFRGCTSLNQNILIPNSVTDVYEMFTNCTNLNQNILIPDSVTDVYEMFTNCTNLNQAIYIYSKDITNMNIMFKSTNVKVVHIRKEIPRDTSNYIYNCLINGNTGITFSSSNIISDLEEPTTWPPTN